MRRILYSGVVGLVLGVLILSFFSWRANQREVEDRREAAPSTGRFIKASDLEIFVQEVGPVDGPAILLIHGTGAWSEIWLTTMNALAKEGFRAIAIDVPPFGYSEKPVGSEVYSREKQAKRIIGILDELSIDSAYLVGHSVGARPTIETALREPGRVKSLILVDPALGFTEKKPYNFWQNDPSWIVKTFFAIKPLRNSVLAAYGTNPFFTKRLFKSFVFNIESVTDEQVANMQKPLVVQRMTPAQADWLEYLMVSHDDSLATNFINFKNLSMQVSLIWGSVDTVTPLWQGEELQKLIPNSSLFVIQGVGHIPYIEDPSRFHDILLGILLEKNN